MKENIHPRGAEAENIKPVNILFSLSLIRERSGRTSGEGVRGREFNFSQTTD